jgi:hypothetical protein
MGKIHRDCFVRYQFTNPFSFGRSVYEYRYKVCASVHRTADISYGVYREPNGKYTAFELLTGGRMYSDVSYNAVIQYVRRMVPKTPDLKKQMSTLSPLMALKEISYEEAHGQVALVGV